ncbi:MAG: enoyl-CoA hydratase [Acidimicrobiaceae bacterium]
MTDGGNDQPFSDLRVSADGAIGELVLNRPERLNALTYTTLRELAAAARWFDQQPDVKVVVVRGEGRMFCAGFDTSAFGSGGAGEVPGAAGSPRANADLGRAMADAIGAMRAVTIAQVHGRAVGGGVVVMVACDLRVVAEDVVISLPEMDLGIPLTWGAVPRLVREIGPSATKDLVMTCRPVGSEEALRLGLVNATAPPDGLAAAVTVMASSVARKSRLTLEQTKRQIDAVAEQVASTASAFSDADLLATAIADPESRAVGRDFVAERARRRR